LTVGVR